MQNFLFPQAHAPDILPKAISSTYPTGLKNHGSADTTHKHIFARIQKFQDELSPEQEIGIIFANIGLTSFVVDRISHQSPDIMIFYGTIDGKAAQLLQHVTQVNLLLVALSPPIHRPVRRIGFHVDEDIPKND